MSTFLGSLPIATLLSVMAAISGTFILYLECCVIGELAFAFFDLVLHQIIDPQPHLDVVL